MADSFAAASDLEARWRTLSPAEQTRADVLLGDASALIRDAAPGIDARIAAETMDAVVPKAIACAMVKRVMQGPTELEGVSQTTQGAGPFSQGVTFANPGGNLYLSRDERRRLAGGRQRAGSVDLMAAAYEVD